MKKLLIALAAVLVATASSYAQGTLTFATRNLGAGVDAPVRFSGGANDGNGPGPSYTAQLFLVSGTTLTPIASSLTTFQPAGSGGAAILNRYVVPADVIVPGSLGGSTVTLRMRAWETALGSYDAALNARGESGDLSVTLGGGGVPPGPPSDLPASFTGFLVVIPEPSTIALGVLGAAALLIRRRK